VAAPDWQSPIFRKSGPLQVQIGSFRLKGKFPSTEIFADREKLELDWYGILIAVWIKFSPVGAASLSPGDPAAKFWVAEKGWHV
jgi:hypothetical protein